MFTGIGISPAAPILLPQTNIKVEHLGTISHLIPNDTTSSGGNGFSATITDVGPILEDVHLGDSISINGRALYPRFSPSLCVTTHRPSVL
jgi:hypothetical protein